MSTEYRVVICIPSTSTWEAEFGMSLLFLANYCAAHGSLNGKPLSYQIQNKRGSILANMRETMVQTALKHKATHLLFIDSDQTFPKETLHGLLAHGKQVVGANVATKQIPSTPTARRKSGDPKGDFVYTTPETTGLERVWRLGTGILLIDLDIFSNPVLHKGPWFEQTWKPDVQQYEGEDWGFCRKLEKAGVPIYVDHDLSQQVGHLGNLTYGHDLVPVEENAA